MIGVVCAIAILSAGCKSKESEAPTPSSTQDVPAETAETEYQPEPVETHEGEPFRSMESEMRILSMNVRWKAALPG